MLDIHLVPLLADNYAYLIRDTESGKTAVVDPSVADGVVAELENRKWGLDYILNTHHHYDHVGGNLELKQRYDCKIVGFAGDRKRIPGLDIAVEIGQELEIGNSKAKILGAAGHTHGHILYWFPSSQALFSGDTLFSLGCGRLFEGTPEEMWKSLSALHALPGSTQVYCGHEYTADNAAFALTIDPNNHALLERCKEIDRLVRAGLPTIPSTLSSEWECNPFLRASDPAIRAQLNLASARDVTVFAEIRKRKDLF
ncbi:MAG: hydroxyacylglutathione hydrolase [Bdellovibrionales bacterium]|nr:hydroxyacylglutathione hydrolase [Bdellovibrionales bacterium]